MLLVCHILMHVVRPLTGLASPLGKPGQWDMRPSCWQQHIPFAQVFTEADQAELQHVIKEINKRIPLGGFVSENRLIGELVRLGVDERLVRRALVFLVSSQAYQYKKARQTLHRICT